MSFIKKQGAGFVLGLLTLILSILGIVYYNINCHTAYFSSLGVNPLVIGCAIAGAVLLAVVLAANQLAGANLLLDVCQAAVPVLLMVAFAQFAITRVNGIASIMTFENNAQTMSDLQSAIIGLVLMLLATLLAIITAFFDIKKS